MYSGKRDKGFMDSKTKRKDEKIKRDLTKPYPI